MTDKVDGAPAGAAAAGGFAGGCCATAPPTPKHRPIRQAHSKSLARIMTIATSSKTKTKMTSELRTETHPEELRFIKALAFDRESKIDPHRTHRRCPGDADASACPDRGSIGDYRRHATIRGQLGCGQGDVLLVVVPQCSEIGPNPAGDAQFFW